MIRNYLKTAYRSLTRNKTFTLINMLGLSLGIAFSAMLLIYVTDELSYDSFHTASDRIFRVVTIDKSTPENIRKYGVTVPPLGPSLMNDFPEVSNVVRLHRFIGQIVLSVDGENYNERSWFSADSPFLRF
jgi:putative ABC transport system permease protein